MSCCENHSKETGLWLGLVSFIIGSVILLQMFGVIPDTTWDYLWPSILIVVGLKLMIGTADKCGSGACSSGGSCGSDSCGSDDSCGSCGSCEEEAMMYMVSEKPKKVAAKSKKKSATKKKSVKK